MSMHEAIDAAIEVFVEECDLPYMARIRDFSDAEIEAGKLREADEEAEIANRLFLRKVISAALPYILDERGVGCMNTQHNPEG